jgi:hypothetical protein
MPYSFSNSFFQINTNFYILVDICINAVFIIHICTVNKFLYSAISYQNRSVPMSYPANTAYRDF